MGKVCKAYILHTFSILSVWFYFEANYKKIEFLWKVFSLPVCEIDTYA